MFDIKQVEKDAQAEFAKERADNAKKKLVAKLKTLADARQVVLNLENEYAVLLRDIGSQV